MMISILVPTMNRGPFIRRMLRYYTVAGFDGELLIGDSSAGDGHRETQEACASSGLKVRYFHLPGISDPVCMSFLVKQIQTPFAAYLGDDDLIVPSTAANCVRFLEANPDHIGAHGKGIHFRLEEEGPTGAWSHIGYYGQTSISMPTAAHRMFHHLTNYSVALFSVIRRAAWIRMYAEVREGLDRTFAGELIPCTMAATLGKIADVGGLYLFRQMHAARYHLPSLFDWLGAPEWGPSWGVFRDELVKVMVEQDQMRSDVARMLVEAAFGAYIAQYAPAYPPDWGSQFFGVSRPMGLRLRQRIYPWIKDLPFYEQANAFRKRIKFGRRQQRFQGEFALSNLLKPNSPHHNEFLPAFKVISGEV